MADRKMREFPSSDPKTADGLPDSMDGKVVLLTTLGLSWAVIPELLGFTNPACVNLYQKHPDAGRIEAMRAGCRVAPVDEVWAVTTSRFDPLPLQAWRQACPDAPALRIWRLTGTPDLSDSDDCRAMADLILRAALMASSASGRVFSLAGGRKTMSADMQRAADVFGCDLLIHVMDRGLPVELRNPAPALLAEPLPVSLAATLMPTVVGTALPSNPVLEVSLPNRPDLRAGSFALELPPPDATPLDVERREGLLAELEHRLGRARNLLFHFARDLRAEERGSGFSALYHLPPAVIRRLRDFRIGVSPEEEEGEMAILRRLPKAELHCHLGGALSTEDLVALAANHGLPPPPWRSVLESAGREWRSWVAGGDPADIKTRLVRQLSVAEGFNPGRPFRNLRNLHPEIPEPFVLCSFLNAFSGQADLLDQVVFGRFREGHDFVNVGIEAYEALGDFQGSALLQSEAALRFACDRLASTAENHHVYYLEVRCSPENYTRGGLSSDRVLQIVRDSFARKEHEKLVVSLLLIASRHGDEHAARRQAELACRWRDANPSDDALVGFDLAGDEAKRSAESMRKLFLPLMDRCMHLTIHAGETAPADSVWQALYHLSAERIGHGLTLEKRAELMRKVAERRVALEMCPSSNVQIVGFRDSFLRRTDSLPEYPLRKYLNEGLRVAICTDNPGISRTDFTRELHRAARLTPGGLSLWEILGLVRTAFRSSFASRERRRHCLLMAEAEIVRLLENNELF